MIVPADVLPAQNLVTFSFRSCIMNRVLKSLVSMVVLLAVVTLVQPVLADSVAAIGAENTTGGASRSERHRRGV